MDDRRRRTGRCPAFRRQPGVRPRRRAGAHQGEGRQGRRRDRRHRRRSASSRPTTSTRSSPWMPTACSTRRSSWTSTPCADCCGRARTSSPRAGSSIRHRTFTEPGEQIRAACADGGTSFHGGGIHPGYAGDILPLTLARVMSRIDTIQVYEVVDVLKDAPLDHIDWMGFGKDKDKFLTEPTILGLGTAVLRAVDVHDRRRSRREHRRGDAAEVEAATATEDIPHERGRDPRGNRCRATSRVDGMGGRQAAHRLPRALHDDGPGQARAGVGLGKDPVPHRHRRRPTDRADPQGRRDSRTER